MLAVPRAILDLLHLEAGATVGLAVDGERLVDQPRPLDLAARKGRKLESVPQPILDDVLAKLATLFT